MVKEFISKLPPDKLTPFKKHPYQVREDVAMDELVESVRTYDLRPGLRHFRLPCFCG